MGKPGWAYSLPVVHTYDHLRLNNSTVVDYKQKVYIELLSTLLISKADKNIEAPCLGVASSLHNDRPKQFLTKIYSRAIFREIQLRVQF